jgi:hypothetical protein
MVALLVVVEHYWQGARISALVARDTPPGPMMLALLAVVGLSGLFVIAETMMSLNLWEIDQRSAVHCHLRPSVFAIKEPSDHGCRNENAHATTIDRPVSWLSDCRRCAEDG